MYRQAFIIFLIFFVNVGTVYSKGTRFDYDTIILLTNNTYAPTTLNIPSINNTMKNSWCNPTGVTIFILLGAGSIFGGLFAAATQHPSAIIISIIGIICLMMGTAGCIN